MVTKSMIGKRVTDGHRTGILREVDPKWEDPTKLPADRVPTATAFVWPEGGGCEWTASPKSLIPA
jgi:hypothetical protein